MCNVARNLEVAGRRLCVTAVPGDRRDEDIAEVGRILAGNFDHYICRRDDNQRGRGPAEVPELLRDALVANGVEAERITLIPDEQESIAAALEMSAADDLLLIFGDNVPRCWKQIIYFNRDPGADEAKAESAPLPPAYAPPPADLPAGEAIEEGAKMVRDERGVRLAREPEDAD